MAPMTPFTDEELYQDFVYAAGMLPADILDMDPDDLVEHCEGVLCEGAAPDGYPQTLGGEINFVTIAGIVRSMAEVKEAEPKPKPKRQRSAVPYNKRFNTVLVYAGSAAPGGSDNERMIAWRLAADADGLTLGRWLAMLADKAAGVE